MNKKLFGFWKYDLFPFILGAEIEDMDEEGRIKAKGYGGYWFKPIRIIPLEEGKKLQKQIKTIKRNYSNEIQSVKDKYENQLVDVFGELK